MRQRGSAHNFRCYLWEVFRDIQLFKIPRIDRGSIGMYQVFELTFTRVLLFFSIDQHLAVHDLDHIPCNADTALDKILTLVDRSCNNIPEITFIVPQGFSSELSHQLVVACRALEFR